MFQSRLDSLAVAFGTRHLQMPLADEERSRFGRTVSAAQAVVHITRFAAVRDYVPDHTARPPGLAATRQGTRTKDRHAPPPRSTVAHTGGDFATCRDQ